MSIVADTLLFYSLMRHFRFVSILAGIASVFVGTIVGYMMVEKMMLRKQK